MKVVSLSSGSLVSISLMGDSTLRTIALVDSSGTSCSVIIENNGAANHFPIVDTMSPVLLLPVAEWVLKRVAEQDREAYIESWGHLKGKSELGYLCKVRALDYMVTHSIFDVDAAVEYAKEHLNKLRNMTVMIDAVADLSASR